MQSDRPKSPYCGFDFEGVGPAYLREGREGGGGGAPWGARGGASGRRVAARAAGAGLAGAVCPYPPLLPLKAPQCPRLRERLARWAAAVGPVAAAGVAGPVGGPYVARVERVASAGNGDDLVQNETLRVRAAPSRARVGDHPERVVYGAAANAANVAARAYPSAEGVARAAVGSAGVAPARSASPPPAPTKKGPRIICEGLTVLTVVISEKQREVPRSIAQNLIRPCRAPAPSTSAR